MPTALLMLSACTSTLSGRASPVTSTNTLIIRSDLYLRLFHFARTPEHRVQPNGTGQKPLRVKFEGALGQAVMRMRCGERKGVATRTRVLRWRIASHVNSSEQSAALCKPRRPSQRRV